MKRTVIKRILFVCICVLFLFDWLPDVFAAKSYRITGVSIDAQLQIDGSMDVIESRTFEFSGSFSFVFRTLATQGRVTFQDFRVSENGRFYELSDSGRPGTYRVTRPSGQIEVRWFFDANNESRTFDFHYRVLNAVSRYEDAAVLYYQFISEEWDRVSQNVRIHVKPPGKLLQSQLNEWLHGPLWAESRIETDGSITALCEHLPSHTYLEIRALYPPEKFHGAPSYAGTVRSRILEEEASWVEESNRKREEAIRDRDEAVRKMEAREQRQEQGKWVVIVLSALGLGFAWQNYRKYGQRPSLPPSVKYASDVPENIPPALVGYLLSSREIYGGAIVSTMIDLARRGFINLREDQEEKKKLFGGTRTATDYKWDLNRDYWREHHTDLEVYEDDLLKFIFDDLAAGGDSIALKEIKKQQTQFTKFFREWKKEVKKLGDKREWFDKESNRGMYYSLGIGIVMIILSGVAAYFIGIWAIVLGVASIAVFVLSFMIPHRTKEGEMLARHWKALKRYLLKYHYRSMDKTALLGRIDDYLVYGIVLGLGQKVFKELAAYIPAEDHQRYVPWYVYRGTGTGSFTPDAFASAFSSMVATTTSAMSTASGTGGGASGGGGGGASSGGGGAG
ncbi:MAG: DUF2207 domain-containing protein [Candidatus Aminicenantaceae bacterium]